MPKVTRNGSTLGCDWCGTTGSTYTVTNDEIWTQWIRSGTGSASTTIADQVWTLWNQTTAITTGAYPMVVHAREQALGRMERRLVSPDRARHEAAERLAVEEGHKRLEACREANRKAEVLLRSCLTQQQIDDLDGKKCFFLYSKGKKYRIDRGQHGNVKLLDQRDQVVESYCIQPQGGLPDADAMLAQKLLLETDPESFRRISNVTTGGRVFAGVNAPALVATLPVPQIQIPQIAL